MSIVENMKYLLLKLSILIVFFLSFIDSIKAQNQLIRKDTIEILEVSGISSSPFKNWCEQLDFAKKGAYENILGKNNLKLLAYKKVKKDPNKIIRAKFDENSLTIIPLDRSNIKNNFLVKKIRNNYILINEYNMRKQSILQQFIYADLDVIELKWEYKMSRFKTYALISKSSNSFVYDDILSNIYLDNIISGYQTPSE